MLFTTQFLSLSDKAPEGDNQLKNKLKTIYGADPAPWTDFVTCKEQLLKLLDYIHKIHRNYQIFADYADNVARNLTSDSLEVMRKAHLHEIKNGIEAVLLQIENE